MDLEPRGGVHNAEPIVGCLDSEGNGTQSPRKLWPLFSSRDEHSQVESMACIRPESPSLELVLRAQQLFARSKSTARGCAVLAFVPVRSGGLSRPLHPNPLGPAENKPSS